MNVQRFPSLQQVGRHVGEVVSYYSEETRRHLTCFRRHAGHTLSCSGVALYETLTELPGLT
jgi:hypothetical protein